MIDTKMESLELFCCQCGIVSPFRKEQIKAGRNSDVWKLSNDEGQWILKNYYSGITDIRDRLGVEFGFLNFLSNFGINKVPKPIGKDIQFNRGLYSFLSGERIQKVETWHITQAVEFLKHINQFRNSYSAQNLPKAADACFSIADHLYSVERRFQRMIKVEPKINIEQDVSIFLKNKLFPAWENIKSILEMDTNLWDNQGIINQSDLIISPSDFGFHNSLQNGTELFFLDFEYAGWDDPAKLICDFICQPEIPISTLQSQEFMEKISNFFMNSETIFYRVKKLLPVHRLKWCCILLNEFNEEDRRRRLHAGCDGEGLEQQLIKTNLYFAEHLIQ